MAEPATLREAEPGSRLQPRAARLRYDILQSSGELWQLAEAWDDLWQRSRSPVPSARAELVIQWLDQFAAGKNSRTIVVYDEDDRLVGALPLVEKRVARFFRAGTLPCNAWSPGGDLMLDHDYDIRAITREMSHAVRELPWPLLWLDDALPQRDDWSALMEALRHDHFTTYHKRFDVAVLDTRSDLATHRAGWSKNHRKSLSRCLRRLENDFGSVSLDLLRPSSAAEAKSLVLRGFKIEDRCWKADNGSSVMRSAGMLEFYTRQAQLSARQGHLALAFLRAGDHDLSFEYGWMAKNIYFSFKVGYDAAFAAYGPGQMLVYLLLERFCRSQDCVAIDCLGPASSAMIRWRPDSYETGRLVVGIGTTGRLLARAYRWARERRGRAPAEPGMKDG